MKTKKETSYGEANIHTENPLDTKETVLVVPGYSEDPTHFKKLVESIGEKGYTALTYSQPRQGGSEADPLDRQGDILLDITETRVHAVAHSLGAAALLKAAIKNPDRFASITLMQPSGFVGEQSLPEVAGRVGKKVFNNQRDALKGHEPGKPFKDGYTPLSADSESVPQLFARVTGAQIKGGNVLAKNPILALKEANAARKYSISENLAAVSKLGIPINVVQSQGDELYDSAKFDEGVAANMDAITSYSTPAHRYAGHDDPWVRAETTAHVIDDFIKEANRNEVHAQVNQETATSTPVANSKEAPIDLEDEAV